MLIGLVTLSAIALIAVIRSSKAVNKLLSLLIWGVTVGVYAFGYV